MKRFGSFSICLLLTGFLLLAQSIYLVTMKVTHLGMMIPAALGVALVALALFQQRWTVWLCAARWHAAVWRIGLTFFFVWLLSLVLFFVWLQRGMTHAMNLQTPQAIVVLGSSSPGGRPSPMLASRLDLALVLARTYPEATVITSGGVDLTEEVAEGEVMARYLAEHGLARTRIRVEGRSSSTQENMAFSRVILQAAGIAADAPVRLVTSDFHTLRAIRIAHKAGLTRVSPAGAETPLYMRYNAWLREYFAYVSGRLLREF